MRPEDYIDHVVRLLGGERTDWNNDASRDRAVFALQAVGGMVRGYTRERGFNGHDVEAEDLASVIVTAATRLMATPDGAVSRTGRGDNAGSVQYAPFRGFNLAELTVLNRYRRRAA